MDRNQKKERQRKWEEIKLIYAYLCLFVVLIIFFATSAFFINFYSNWKAERKELEDYIRESKINAILNELSKEDDLPSKKVKKEAEVNLTPEEQFDLYIDRKIYNMPIEEKVAGLFFVTPEALTEVKVATQASDATKYALEQYPVGGIIYFSQNIQSVKQISEMISNSKKYCKYPIFIGIDEEGGSVSRIANAGLTEKVPSAAEIGATNNYKKAYETGIQIGAYLSELGFNVNFAPVADIANVENSIMKDRAYGTNANAVSNYAVPIMNGLHDVGVTACLKHFPGIGSVAKDIHDGQVTIEKSAIELRTEEFQVFKAGIKSGANMIMISHASVPELDAANTPASLSKIIVTDVLRKELKYDGIVITDALNMAAITEYYNSAEAAIMALNAGCDMLLMPENFKEAYEGIMEAVKDGIISEEQINESLKRIYRIKYAEHLKKFK